MNTLRWIAGLPLTIITTLLFGWGWQLLYDTELYDYAVQHHHFHFIIKCVGSTLANSIFLVSACFYMPSSKKYVGFSCIAICLVYGVYQYFSGQIFNGNNDPLEEFLDSFSGLAGLAIGFYLSYSLFKNAGWTTVKAEESLSL